MSNYEKRLQRIRNAVEFRPVDKIPVSISGPAFVARSQGIIMKDYITDYENSVSGAINLLDTLGSADSIQEPITMPLNVEKIWLSPVALPGDELDDDEIWQVREGETMKREDYDYIFDHGFFAFMDKLSREHLHYGDPRVQRYADYQATAVKRISDAGYPVIKQMSMAPPFENFCGGRSLFNFFVEDLMEEPDMVEKALRIAQRESVASYRQRLEKIRPMGAWVSGWRSAPQMISHEWFDRFVWPYMKELAMTALEYGCIPIFHLDSCWDREIEHFLELPARSCIMALDGSTDIRAARKILDGHMCIMGDVPASKLAFGSAEEVYRHTKQLIDDVGPDTGYIVCSGCDIPDNAKIENVMAMCQAAKDYI